MIDDDDDDWELLRSSVSPLCIVRRTGKEAVDKIVRVRSVREISTFASIEFDSNGIGVNGSDAEKDLFSLTKKEK